MDSNTSKNAIIVFAAILLAAFFMPWLTVFVSINAWDLIFGSIGQAIDSPVRFLGVAIPLSSALIIYAAGFNKEQYPIQKSFLCCIPLITLAILAIIISSKIGSNNGGGTNGDIIKVFGFGFWLTLSGSIALAILGSIDGKQKSLGVAILLAFLFGPLGLFYASVKGGVVALILGTVISILVPGFGTIVVWIACIIWAVVATKNANSKVASVENVNIDAGTLPSQQPVAGASQRQPIIQPPPQGPQQPSQVTENKPEYALLKQKEDNIENTNDLSLNSFSNWVTNNKKGLIFGLGGIVVVLVLIVAIKFVFSLDFGKHNQSINLAKNNENKDSIVIEGDANAPIPVNTNSGSTNSNSTNYPGLYPQSSVRLLISNDVANLNKRDLKIMRNEIFARHGYIFKTADMKNYFIQQNWYRAMYNDVTNQLTNIEKTNVDFIKRYEK